MRRRHHMDSEVCLIGLTASLDPISAGQIDDIEEGREAIKCARSWLDRDQRPSGAMSVYRAHRRDGRFFPPVGARSGNKFSGKKRGEEGVGTKWREGGIESREKRNVWGAFQFERKRGHGTWWEKFTWVGPVGGAQMNIHNCIFIKERGFYSSTKLYNSNTQPTVSFLS